MGTHDTILHIPNKTKIVWEIVSLYLQHLTTHQILTTNTIPGVPQMELLISQKLFSIHRVCQVREKMIKSA